jgi:hypothetical protein
MYPFKGIIDRSLSKVNRRKQLWRIYIENYRLPFPLLQKDG